MPIYEYRCQQCGKEFEVFRGVRDAADPVCRFCSGPVRRLISASSFHLKGSGWYATDYARKKSDTGKKEDKSETSDSGIKTEKSESSTAAKEGATST